MDIREVNINGAPLQIGEQERELLRATASQDEHVATKKRQALAQVIERAWKAGVLHPDLVGDIYTRIDLAPGADSRFPLDFYSPSDEEGELHKGIVVPKEGAIPEHRIEGDEIYIPTFKIANSVDWALDYARDARWDVVARAMEVFTNGITQKINDEGWHVVLSCAATNSVSSDSTAASGTFTINLVTKLMTDIKRTSGGRGARVTDLYISPEAMADVRNLSSFIVTDAGSAPDTFIKEPNDDLKRMLLSMPEGESPSLFGVRMHELHELGFPAGVDGEYQSFLKSDTSASLATGDEQFVVALDLANRDSFVMPVREDLQMFDDPRLHRQMRAGVYGWIDLGFGCLDTRRAILGSF